MESFELCKENGITMLTLPPHCSHRLQPLDVTFFSPLKGAFKSECERFMKAHKLVRITPYDLAGLFNQAYSRVATVGVGVSGFRSTGIYPFNPEIFSDVDYCAADYLDAQNTSLPAVDMTFEAESQELSEENAQPTTTFEELIPIPSTSTSCQQKIRKREKQQSEILTSTPKKKLFETAILKKENKVLKTEISTLKKQIKGIIGNAANESKPKTGKKEVKKPQKKSKKIVKRTIKFEVPSDSEEEGSDLNEKELCDDDDMDDLPGAEEHNVCYICGEFGKDGEEWYRCTSCGLWMHSLCSGSDSAEGFLCDRCIKKTRA